MNETTAAIPPVENSVEYVDVPAPTPKDLMIGIDIGGTGMKGGIVDLRTGNLVSERFRIPTPHRLSHRWHARLLMSFNHVR